VPKLQIDNREIIAARLTSHSELQSKVLTGPVAAYLGRLPTARLRPRVGLKRDDA
jgi:hypothetical protein